MSLLHSNSPSIWSIQEIVDLISKYLDKKSIVQCVQVSRAWHAAWLPSLWAQIEADHWRSKSFRASLPAHGDLIRVLKCMRYDELELLGPNATRLSWLEMPKTTLLNMHDHVRILQQNRDTLHTLSLIFNDVDDVSQQFLPLLKTIRQLHSLKTLKFDNSHSLDEAALEYVLGGQHPEVQKQQRQEGDNKTDSDNCDNNDHHLRPCPIQELSLSGISFFRHPFNHGESFANKEYIASRRRQHQSPDDDDEDEDTNREVVRETRLPFNNITSLILEDVNCDPELVLNLTSRFPALQRLSLKDASEFYPDPTTFPEVLARHCPHLRWLDISNQETMTDDFIASLIRRFPRLTTLKANDTLFSEESMKALVDNCQDLVRLEISSCYNITSTTIQRFLCQCSTLRHLDAWESSLNAVDMVASFFWRGRHDQSQRANRATPAEVSQKGALMEDGWSKAASLKAAEAAQIGKGGWWACSRSLESLTIDIVYTPWSNRQVRQFLHDLMKAGPGHQLSSKSLPLSSSSHTTEADDDGDDWMSTTSLSKIGLLLTDKKHARNVAYQQLGRLINVRVLCVGSYEPDPEGVEAGDEGYEGVEEASTSLSALNLLQDPQPWIDFSLASGLDHLRELKKLREISFIRIGRPPEHHVEQAELEWMLKHWPNLRMIEGLDQRNEDEEEGIDEEEPVNELVAWLNQKRPDIIVDEEYI
ncbi:hypothetical protein BGW41_003115 [Actinomortierella wolfii]|nr:hypothetical protein BGW41_003115 [Actinomortierella wolfii]